MNKYIFIAGLIGILVGLVVGSGAMYVLDSRSVISESVPTSEMHDSMSEMMSGLHNKTGDQFDQAFLQEMIVHHQGAVAMAKAALMHANHQEIKDLATAIVVVQEKEITQMQEWLDQWYQN